jgi:hypothetical protein
VTPLAASTFVWVFILLPVVVIWVVGLVDILRRDLSRQAKAAWALVVVLLPILGTLVYWILRKPTDREIELASQATAAQPEDWEPRVRRGVPGE